MNKVQYIELLRLRGITELEKGETVEVLEIRKKRTENKLTYQKLAEMYNVSYGCIAGIIQRTNWKHI